ncbi:MAG: diguanylate cyclase (GGDEF)-like protein/PAS domain S-box-containing protein [Colwellia sp.]
MSKKQASTTHSSQGDKVSIEAKMLGEVLNNVGAFIYTKDLKGFYTYVNKAVLDLFDKKFDEVVGFDDSHFFDLDLSEQLKKNDQRVMLKGIDVESEETNYIKSLKETRIYKTVKKPLFDKNGNIVGMCGISTDITDEKNLQKMVKSQKQLLNAVLDNADAYIYMKDIERTFQYVNSKVAELFGESADNIIGKKDTEVLSTEVAEHFHLSDQKVFETNEKQIIEESSEDENGELRHYISTKIPYQLEGGIPALIGFSTDVTELYALKEEFKKQANTDSLTELYNRRYFTEHAQREFYRAKRHLRIVSLISIDIDHFKHINDGYGHPAGDKVLISVAKCLLPCIRQEDILARIGGEEFSILLPETTLKSAKVVAERIRLNQSNLSIEGEWKGEITLTVSVGVTCIRFEDDTFDDFFTRADKALYQAKALGRNQVYYL